MYGRVCGISAEGNASWRTLQIAAAPPIPRLRDARRMNHMVRSVAIFFMSAVAAAQTGVSTPAFEVASVKRFVPQLRPGIHAVPRSDPPPSQLQVSGTRVSISGNLMRLVAASYGLEPYQVRVSEEWTDTWANSTVYDIIARAPAERVWTLPQVREMMQKLLAERFQLKVSHRSQVMPVYELVAEPGGAKVKPSSSTDPPLTRDDGSAGSNIRLQCRNLSMADLVELVRREFDRPVVDKTGLTGAFDFSLDYTSQRDGNTASMAPPIAAALREQLGLKVIQVREQVGILVIDSAERPSAN
jgi:uncharacterized protein (TIGR03435 family)